MPSDVTQLLTDLRGGKPRAADELFPLVLDELRRLAAGLLLGERPGHTLSTTGLVHEAYLRLVKLNAAGPEDRAHFLAVAARAMRRILVDHARQRNRAKREGRHDRVPLDSALIDTYESTTGLDIEPLDAALTGLAGIRPRAAEVVDMRFFAEMTVEEIACVLGTSVSTVEREWRYARAWLKNALRSGPAGATETAGDEQANRATGC